MLYKKTLIFISILLASSCSSRQTITTIPSETVLLEQEKRLKALYIGQPKEEVMKKIHFNYLSHFEVEQNAQNYLYLEHFNKDTNITFGFFFKNNKLSAILSQEDSQTLFACRTPFNTNNKHWLTYGITPYEKWIVGKNSLNEHFDYRVYNPKVEVQHSELNSTIENVTTFIAYSPFLVIGAPFIAYGELTGEYEKQNEKQKKLKALVTRSQKIQLGDTMSNIKQQLGEPEQYDSVNQNLVLTYFPYSYSYAVDDNNKVVWKEHFSMLELYHRQQHTGSKLYGNYDCGELATFWKSKIPQNK